MILDLFLLRVFHAPSYCSYTSNLIMFSLIIDYWIENGIHSSFIMIIINLIIDKSRLFYKITIKYWQNVTYSQLYYRIKPRSRPPQNKIRIFYAPRFFSSQNKKSAQITQANTVFSLVTNFSFIYLSPRMQQSVRGHSAAKLAGNGCDIQGIHPVMHRLWESSLSDCLWPLDFLLNTS